MMIEEAIRLGWVGSVPCPFHSDRSPSAKLFPGGSFHCFVCGAHAHSTLDLLRQLWFPDAHYQTGMSMASHALHDHGLITGEARAPERRPEPDPVVITAMTIYRRLAQDHLRQHPEIVTQLQQSRGLQDPLAMGLGLSDASLLIPAREHLYACGWDEEEVGQALREAGLINAVGHERLSYPHPRLIIPEQRGGQTWYYQARGPSSPKYLNPALPKPLFGLESLAHPSPFIVVAEGPFDILPLLEAGASAVAVLGVGSGVTELEQFRERPLVIGFDGDEAGLEKGAQVTTYLQRMGCDATHMPPPKRFKDYSEWLSAVGAREVLAEITWGLP